MICLYLGICVLFLMNILDFIFPKRCVGCGSYGSYFCNNCINNIQQDNLVCPVCERSAIGGETHPLCRSKYRLDGLWSLGVYQGSLKLAIQKLKYRWVTSIAQTLVDILVEYWAKFSPWFFKDIKKTKGAGWVVVPVPLYWTRQNLRGFNQSSLIGKLLSRSMGLGYSELLIRNRLTKTQVGRSSKDRKQNIKGAFSISATCTLPPANCLLIDDVWTTGSTLKECAYVLKRAGVKKVWAITLAR